MKIEKEIIDQMESCDAYFMIGVRDKIHFTSIGSTHTDDTKTMHHLVQGMLGSVDDIIKSKKQGNGMVLMVFAYKAAKTILKDFLTNT